MLAVSATLLLMLAYGTLVQIIVFTRMPPEIARVFFVALALSGLLSLAPIAVLWFLDRREREAPWLFAAAFLGRQDAFWIAEAGLHGTCVDLDGRKLREMRKLYPRDWSFVEAEVFEYVSVTDKFWDVVSVDCPSGAFARCADLLHAWCNLAERLVILGTSPSLKLDVPSGWDLVERRPRSTFAGGTEWAVLEAV